MHNLVARRKREIRHCIKLPNQQLLNVYFSKKPLEFEDRQMNAWRMGVMISSTRRQANDWYMKCKDNRIESTGDCGLTGLMITKDIILDFVNRLKENEILLVEWEDDKRMRAYRWLLRYGFEEIEDQNGELFAYAGLNQKYRSSLE